MKHHSRNSIAFIVAVLTLFCVLHVRAGSFTNIGSMNVARYRHTATLLPNGTVLVAGGETNSSTFSSAEVYNPTTDVWTNTSPMHFERSAHTATLLSNGKVLVAGGQDSEGNVHATAELYNPEDGTWTLTGSMTNFAVNGRSFHTATLLPDGKVLVAGGGTGTSDTQQAEVYDPDTGSWNTPSLMNNARALHAAVLLPDGNVMVVGGMKYSSVLSSVELYNPTTHTWTNTGALNHPRWNLTATLLTNGQVLVAFGSGYPSPVSKSELYDPVTHIWTDDSEGPSADVGYATATLLPNGKVLVAGGNQLDESILVSQRISTARLYNPATHFWTSTGSLATERATHTATLLPNGKVLVAGGFGNADNFSGLSSVELFDPAGGPIMPIVLTNLSRQGSALQFSFSNTPGVDFSVSATTNLSLSFTNWTPLGDATEISTGEFKFIDAQATNTLQRFYRAQSK